MRTIWLSVFFMIGLAGCTSIPQKMVGQFDAPGGEFIVIKRDGSVLWSPQCKTGDKLSFVGIAAPERSEPLIIPLIVPSASPFLYAKLTFSPDYSHLTVDWGKVMSARAMHRASEYDRQK